MEGCAYRIYIDASPCKIKTVHIWRHILSHREGADCRAPRLFRETGLGSGHVQGGPYNTPSDGLCE